MRRRRPRPAVFALACGLALTACSLDRSGLGGPGTALDDDDGAGGPPSTQDGASAESFDAVALGDGQRAPPVGSSSGGGSDAQGDDAPLDAPSPPDPDAATSPCDEDGDGHAALGPACGGDDCCDIDANAHPGQGAFFTQLDQCGSFDYDCDGKLTPQYGAVSCQWQLVSCSGSGFDQPPACGVAGKFETCAVGFFTCSESAQMRLQSCR